MGRAAALAACLLVLAGVRPAEAQVRDLSVRWRTVQGEHFEVHYPEPLALLARRVLAIAERVQGRLGPIMGHTPSGRVQIVLTDESESANGSANVLHYNAIRLFASAPDDLSVLSDFDDWMTTLITHEHTHILHLDNISGLPALVNKVVGKIWAPNEAEPRWIIEGMATYMESAETAGGRLRSTQFEMYMRAAVLENAVLGIDQISNGVDEWPHGNVWYLYGSRFIAWIAERYGQETVAKMAEWYGRRAIPYSLNRMMKRLVGHTFVELYAMWLEDMRHQYAEVAREVRDAGLVEGTRLTFHGETVRGLRFVDNERLVFFVSDGRSDSQLRELNVQNPDAPRQLTRVAGTAYPTQHPDGSLYYESLDAYRTIFFYYDLFRLDPDTHKRRRLTRGLRARHPDLSPDGRHITFVVSDAGTTHLMLADTGHIKRSQEQLFQSQRYEQVYTPRFSPDGQRIAYSVWRKGGYRDIHVIDLRSREVVEVTHDRALDTGPAWSPDGKQLYFSSDRSGISNIYGWNTESGALEQITNVVSGAYHPAPSPDGTRLAYIGYTHLGYDVYLLDLNDAAHRTAAAYEDNRPPSSDTDALMGALSTRYRPIYTLYPRFYTIDFNEDGFGRQLGVSVEGEDVVGFHSFDARVGVSLEKGHVNADFRYTWQRSPAPVSLFAFRRVAPRRDLIVGDVRRTWLQDAYGGRLAASYRVPRSFHSNVMSLSYGLTKTRKLEPFGGVLDPNTGPPVIPDIGFSADVALGWNYSDVRQHTYDMTPSEGRSLALSLAFADPFVGNNDFNVVRFSWAVRRFIEMPWAEHHVLSIRYAGGISGDSRGERAAFGLGGFPDVSFLDQLLNNTSLGGQALRGYGPFAVIGDRFHLIQSEYRFPIARVQRGPQTVPVYMNRIYGSAFVDWGNAFFDRIDLLEFRTGVGAELFFDFTAGYFLFYTLRLGFAYGLRDDGGARVYAHFGVPF